MLSVFAKEQDVRPFELPGVNIFTGNELDPTDEPDAALIFGGDGTLHRHLGALALKKIPTLAVPIGSANDFAATGGIHSVEDAITGWRRFCETRENMRLIDLGTIQPLDPVEAAELKPPARSSDPNVPWGANRSTRCTSFPVARAAICHNSARASSSRSQGDGLRLNMKPRAPATSHVLPEPGSTQPSAGRR